MKDLVCAITGVMLFVGIFAVIVIGLLCSQKKFNTKKHSDDITVTEWVSPDGVHYWYQQAAYHAMLAPRYDSDGNLVIDKVVE